MAVEQPIITSIIARMARPELNLAAFGITFSLALMVESPIIMLLTAGTALARSAQSYHRLLQFTHLICLGLTAIHLIISLPPVYRLIVQRIIGAPQEVIELSRQAFLLMVPWSAAVAYRRLWQGVLIRYDRTGVVPVTIAARLAVSAAILGAGLVFNPLEGVHIAAVALSCGVVTAMAAAYGFVRSTVKERFSYKTGINDHQKHVSQCSGTRAPANHLYLAWGELLRFYIPLALTSFIALGSRPVLTIALARAPMPLKSLAVWPVILALIFLGRSIGLSYQEAVIALLQDEKNYHNLRRFTIILTAVLSLVFYLTALTPLKDIWYENVAGLPSGLTGFTTIPTFIMAAVPGIGAMISLHRGILVHAKSTIVITRATALFMVVLAGVMFGMIGLSSIPGVLIAAISFLAARSSELCYLWRHSRKPVSRLRSADPDAQG